MNNISQQHVNYTKKRANNLLYIENAHGIGYCESYLYRLCVELIFSHQG